MTTPKVTAEEAQRNAAAIRQLYRDGQLSLKRRQRLERADPTAYAHGHKLDLLQAEADRMGINADTLKKVWRLVDEYTPDAVDALSDLVVRHQSRFGPTNLVMLLRVADRKQRDRLMGQAVRAGWTFRQLERAIQAQQGRRQRQAGRKPLIPADPTARLVALDALADKWTRWCDAATPDLPEDLHDLIARASKAVQAVKKAVTQRLDHDQSGG